MLQEAMGNRYINLILTALSSLRETDWILIECSNAFTLCHGNGFVTFMCNGIHGFIWLKHFISNVRVKSWKWLEQDSNVIRNEWCTCSKFLFEDLWNMSWFHLYFQRRLRLTHCVPKARNFITNHLCGDGAIWGMWWELY